MKQESYRDPCPKCGARLIGFDKEGYVEHLRENGEELAAKIEDRMVVDPSELNCAGANSGTGEGIAPAQADASGYQMHDCPGCGERTDHEVWVTVGENADVSIRKCEECGHEWKAIYADGEWTRERS